MNGYGYVLHFVRHFTRGTMIGIRHSDSIGFCSRNDCLDWVHDVNRAHELGKLPYVVEAYVVQVHS